MGNQAVEGITIDTFQTRPIPKLMTFAGGTANDPGDHDGTGNPATLYTVTGDIAFRLKAVCTVDLAGASATIEVGTSFATAGIIAQTTATNIVEGELWHDASPDADVELITVLAERVLVNSGDIIQTVATQNITAGAIQYDLFWRPLSDNATVVAA